MSYSTIDGLYAAVRRQLAKPGYSETYANEDEFEADVWRRLWDLVEPGEAPAICLTSHKKRAKRSEIHWNTFCRRESGADVRVLGSNNRLDIVVSHRLGTIGVEVKCLGPAGHTSKLTQGLGQAVLGLANRDRTLLMIHCGTRPDAERKALRKIAGRITAGSATAIIVVP